MNDRDYYCSEKFEYLSLRLFDGMTASCCAADPEKLSINQLTKNNAFNYQSIQDDRKKMLSNLRIPSCESACWSVEDSGVLSRRLKFSTGNRYTTVDNLVPKVLSLEITSVCNQSCVYCNKNHSVKWLHDLSKNGNYEVNDDRYKITPSDKIMLLVKQSDTTNTKIYTNLLNYLESIIDKVDRLIITGGEPLLSADLEKILQICAPTKKITIHSGLAVSPNRIMHINKLLAKFNNVDFGVSAENISKLHEFNRFGSDYVTWLKNFQLISNNYNYHFNCVISNLTSFGLLDFINKFNDANRRYVFLNVPAFLSLSVLDSDSKELLRQNWLSAGFSEFEQATKLFDQPVQKNVVNNFFMFITRYIKHKNLSLDVFPPSFVSWIKSNI